MGSREGLVWVSAQPAHQRLTTPWDVEAAAITAVRMWHTTHLASYERALGLQPRTLEGFRVVDHINGGEGRQAGQHPPACLFYVAGTAATPQETELDRLDVSWALGMLVVAIGKGHVDAVRRRDALTWTAIESVLCHTTAPVSAITLTDVENEDPEDGATRYLAHSRTMFTASSQLAVLTRWGIDTQPPLDPYADPGDDPKIRRIDHELRKEVITAW